MDWSLGEPDAAFLHELNAVAGTADGLLRALAAAPPGAAFPTAATRDLVDCLSSLGQATAEGALGVLFAAGPRLTKLRRTYGRSAHASDAETAAFLRGDAVDRALTDLLAAIDAAAVEGCRQQNAPLPYDDAPSVPVSAAMRIALDQAARKARLLTAEADGLARRLGERMGEDRSAALPLERALSALATMAGVLGAELAMPDQQPRLLARMAAALDRASDAAIAGAAPLAALVEAENDRADWIGGFAWPALEAQTRHAEDLARELEGVADTLLETGAGIGEVAAGPKSRLDWSDVNQRQLVHLGLSVAVATCFGLVFGAFR